MNAEEKSIIYKVRSMLCSDRAAVSPQFITICNGVIRSISEAEYPDRGSEFVDFGHLVSTPLFCDYHLHFMPNAENSVDSKGLQLQYSGIGRAFEGGDRECYGLSVRNTLGQRPEIRSAGFAIFRKGGYGKAIGQGVDSVKDARGKISELLSLSVDYIKIINSGVYEPESDQISTGGFEDADLLRIVDYAREKGLDVYCHANGEEAVRAAVRAGVSVIIHGLYACDETFAEMAEKGVAFIPTLRAFQSLLAIAKTGVARRNVEKTVSAHLSAVNRAFERKVRVLPGSDSGPRFIPYGSAYLEELRLFLKAGIPFENVIRSAAASTLSEGAPADFVLLDDLSVKHVVLGCRLLY